jgi:hypothetical protein
MHLGGEVLVSELRSTVADDDIAIGSVADRCLLSGVIQTSHFKGVRTGFDPIETSAAFHRARYDYVLTDVVRGHLHLQIPKQILSIFLLRNFVLHPTNAVRPV